MAPSRLLVLPLAAFALAVTLSGGMARAAEPHQPPDLTADERRAYNLGLEEARKFMADKEWTRASKRLDTLIDERPREAQARFLKGVVQVEQGDVDGAIATFRGLNSDYPEIPEPYNNLAVLYGRKGELENARAALETAVKTAPDWALAHENLGDVYLRMAADEYERATSLDRTNRTAPSKLKLARELLASAAKP